MFMESSQAKSRNEHKSLFVDINKDKRYLVAYQDIAKTITSTLEIEEVMQRIVEKLAETVGVRGVTIRLLDEAGENLELYASYGLSEECLKHCPYDSRGKIEEVLEKESVTVYSMKNAPCSRYHGDIKGNGNVTILAVPIPIQGEVRGVLRLLTDERRHYDEDEINFVQSIAEQCGIAIENACLYETQKSQVKYLNALHNVAKAVNSTLELDEVLSYIVSCAPEIMGVDAVTIRLLDEDKQKLELVAASGLSDKYLSRGPIDAEKNIELVLRGKPVAIYDVVNDPRVQYRKEAKEEGIESLLATPIIVADEIIGVMRFLTKKKRRFSKEEISFSVALAETCGIAIKNARMYEQINSLLGEISQLEKSKSVFLQIAAHELKSPVAVIQSLLMTLRAAFKKDLPPKAIELLDRAINRCLGMLDLTKDLLEYSRLTHHAVADEPEEDIDLAGLLAERLESYADQTNQKQISLESSIEPSLPPVRGVKKELQQVVDNLVSNAIRYTPSGGRVSVVLKGDREKGELVFIVSDTGIGIPEKDIPNLFKEFFRSSNAKEFVAVGTGLGLTITKNIVDKMGGSIHVESELGKGTTFEVRLPFIKG